ncbi:MAG TPA: Hsp20/alpha crystallin family protein [bacterium]|nr:Hsp20/alpha crystallin family protein [bacterium]
MSASRIRRGVNRGLVPIHRREVRASAFTRTLPLPSEVKCEEAKTVCKHGVLEVTIPKTERTKPTTVKAQVA